MEIFLTSLFKQTSLFEKKWCLQNHYAFFNFENILLLTIFCVKMSRNICLTMLCLWSNTGVWCAWIVVPPPQGSAVTGRTTTPSAGPVAARSTVRCVATSTTRTRWSSSACSVIAGCTPSATDCALRTTWRERLITITSVCFVGPRRAKMDHVSPNTVIIL